MKDFKSNIFSNRKSILVFLLISISFAGHAQWTYTISVHQTGSCIPYPVPGTVPFATKSACEADRQSTLNNVGDWTSYSGNTPCVTTVTCSACTGSDMGSSGQSSSNGLPTPESVLTFGLEQGKAFYSPHQSREVEDWIEDYWQRMKSLGLPYAVNSNLTPDDVPLTGDIKFDNLYTNLMSLYSNMNPGGAMDLNSKKDTETKKNEPDITEMTVPVMGSAPMTQNERERQNLNKEVGHTIGYDQYAWNTATNGNIGDATENRGLLSDSKENKLLEFSLEKLGDTEVGALPAFAGKVMLKTADNALTFLYDATIDHKFTSEQISEMNPASYIVGNTIKEMASETFVGKISGEISGLVTDLSVGVISKAKGYDAVLMKTNVGEVFKALGMVKTVQTVKDIWDAPRIKDMH